MSVKEILMDFEKSTIRNAEEFKAEIKTIEEWRKDYERLLEEYDKKIYNFYQTLFDKALKEAV